MTKPPQKKPAIGLVFCEDENDAEALKNIARAVRPLLPPISYCRKPLILVRNRKDAEARKKNGADVYAVVRAKNQIAEVKFVIAHQDCDDIEPAHKDLASKIETELAQHNVPNIIGVAPAWEIEAWWFLWPDAVASVNSKWKRLKRNGNHGMIKDAKETLRRDLRNPRTRDYEESDSRNISKHVLTNQLLEKRIGTSGSFDDFRTKIETLDL